MSRSLAAPGDIVWSAFDGYCLVTRAQPEDSPGSFSAWTLRAGLKPGERWRIRLYQRAVVVKNDKDIPPEILAEVTKARLLNWIDV